MFFQLNEFLLVGQVRRHLMERWRVRIKIALMWPFVQLYTPVTVSFLTAHTGSMKPSNIDLIMNCVFFDSHRVHGREIKITHFCRSGWLVDMSKNESSAQPSFSIFYFHFQLLIPILLRWILTYVNIWFLWKHAVATKQLQFNQYKKYILSTYFFFCDKKLFGMSLRSHTMIFLECQVMQK